MKALINILVLMLLGLVNLQAQKHDYVWCLWDSVGLDFNQLDESGHPRVFRPRISSGFQFLSYSDSSGQLQFYLDPRWDEHCAKDDTLWGVFRDHDNEIILNGDSIISSWGGVNSSLALPVLQNNQTHILTFNYELSSGIYGFVGSFFEHIVSNGHVESKNIKIENNRWLTSGLTAVKTADNQGWWLVAHEALNDTFVIYLLDSDGLRLSHKQQIGFSLLIPSEAQPLNPMSDTPFQSSFSPDGTMLLQSLWSGRVQLLDFNRVSGLFSRHQVVMDQDDLSENALYNKNRRGELIHHSCFSPRQDFIYFCSGLSLFQCNLIDKRNSGIINLIDELSLEEKLQNMRLGSLLLSPSEKVYLAVTYRSSNCLGPSRRLEPLYSLSVINHPDRPFPDCSFKRDTFYLEGGLVTGSSLNYPNYRLPPLCLETVSADAGKDTSICPRKTIVIGSQPAPGLSCRWTPTSSLSGSTSCRPFASPDTTTTYILEVYAENCPSAFDTITVTVLEETAAPCTSISRTARLEPEISIYPNPADASVSVSYEMADDKAQPVLEVFDLLGRRVLSHQLDKASGVELVETSSWVPGLYVFRLNGWAQKVLIAR